MNTSKRSYSTLSAIVFALVAGIQCSRALNDMENGNGE